MSVNKPPALVKLEDDPIWKESCDLAEHMYGKLHEFPEEEKWESERKLRSAANELMYYTAQAIGNASPSNTEYDWGNVRRFAAALKTVYRFSTRQKYIELDPQIMVRLTKLMGQIDSRLKEAYSQTKEYNERESRRWRENYETWKAANHEAKS